MKSGAEFREQLRDRIARHTKLLKDQDVDAIVDAVPGVMGLHTSPCSIAEFILERDVRIYDELLHLRLGAARRRIPDSPARSRRPPSRRTD